MKKAARRVAVIAPAVAAGGVVLVAVQANGSAAPLLIAAVGHARPNVHLSIGGQPTGSRPGATPHAGSTTHASATVPNKTAAGHAASRKQAHRPASTPSPGSASPSQAPAKSANTLSCTGTSGMLPQNYATIVSFLTTHGYTKMAAAGIAGNMYQESQGNPESVGSGGGGLIGFTPLPAGYVTGNPAADLHTQLEAVLAYNQQWAQYIPALNAATSPSQAADIYMNDFERPGIPAAYNREAAANAVAAACGF